MQSTGLITCAKHYLLYEQEPVCTGPVLDGSRSDCSDVNSVADGGSRQSLEDAADAADKTLKELYLPSFAESIRAGTGAVMW